MLSVPLGRPPPELFSACWHKAVNSAWSDVSHSVSFPDTNCSSIFFTWPIVCKALNCLQSSSFSSESDVD